MRESGQRSNKPLSGMTLGVCGAVFKCRNRRRSSYENATPSDVPAFAEPFFLNFQANCKFRILMSPEDLQKAGLEELGKKWA